MLSESIYSQKAWNDSVIADPEDLDKLILVWEVTGGGYGTAYFRSRQEAFERLQEILEEIVHDDIGEESSDAALEQAQVQMKAVRMQLGQYEELEGNDYD